MRHIIRPFQTALGVPVGSFRSFSIPAAAPALASVAPAELDTMRPADMDLDALASLIAGARGRLLVLSGAGVSTDSGVPDYRSPSRIGKFNPIRFQEFVQSAHTRQRYWARSCTAHERFQLAQPNATHHTLAKWESAGLVSALITQNVDSLHLRAGSKNVVELHGNLREVLFLLLLGRFASCVGCVP